MKNFMIRSMMAAFGGMLVSTTAWASDSPWSVYVGAAHVGFFTTASVKAGGVEVSGADASASNNKALSFGAIYHLNPNWSAELALGLPPTSTLSGRGALVSAGMLGKVQYGPAVLSLRHTFLKASPIRPYLGVGVNYTRVFKSTDGFVQGLHTESAFGSVLQLGVELPMKDNWGVLLDFKKIWLSTTAKGTLPAFGGVPASADVRLDPLVATLALSYRF